MSITTFLLPVVVELLAPTSLQGANPVLTGADPHAVYLDGRVWVYPTHHTSDLGFSAYSSQDLKTWRDEGMVLRFADVKWISEDGERTHWPWAPALAVSGSKYYFYYSVGPQGRTPSRIGVAVGDSPKGPFIDSGRPLLTGGNGFEAIDPMVFQDPKSGRWYLYAGGSAGAKLRIFELNRDLTTLLREISVKTPPKFTEAPFVHYRRGTYYLSYSHGGWRDRTYSSHYATSGTPVGPWRYGGEFLGSDERHKGPGHHSIFRGRGEDEWFIAYHRWNNAIGPGPYRGARQTCIQRLEHAPGGVIKRVRMSDLAPEFAAK